MPENNARNQPADHHRGPPPLPPALQPNNNNNNNNNTNKSLLASMIRWLQIKKYQYEVTFSLYMLTPTEKFVFNVIILAILSLLIAAAVCYLPNHIAIVSNRLWYYVHGEFLYNHNHHHYNAAAVDTAKGEVRRLVTDALTSGSSAAVAGVARETAERVVEGMREL